MKLKFTAIYVLAALAFVGVSAWVFLSRGRNAKAIAAKYKLGGIMLTAWSMLAAASCEVPGVSVTCYDPVEPVPEVMCYDVAAPTNLLTVSVKDKDGMDVQPGDILKIDIEYPEFAKYVCNIVARNSDSTLIQSETFGNLQCSSRLELEMTLEKTDYKGEALVNVIGIYNISDTETAEQPLDGEFVINYL